MRFLLPQQHFMRVTPRPGAPGGPAVSSATVSIVDNLAHSRPRAIQLIALRTLVLALSLLTLAAHAATYYVAPNGADSAAGSLAQPWATLQNALEKIVAGDTILMQPGSYDYQHNIDTVVGGAARTTIRANGGPVFLSGSGICINNINYTIDGLTFTNITFAHHINACVAVNTGGHGAQILNCRMAPVTEAIFGIYWLDVPDSTPATHQTPNLTAGNCIISNNILSQLAGCHAIKIGGSNTMVLNNVIRDSKTIDLFVIHGCSNVVRGNYSTNIIQIQGLGIHPDIIQTWGQVDMQPNAPFCDSYGNIVEGNRFYDFDGALSQLSCDYSADGTIPTVGGWIVRNNLYVRCGPIGGGSVSSVDIPNSRFYNNTYIQCGNDPEDSGGEIGFAYHTTRNGSATNCYVYNNAFIACGNNTSSGWYSQEGDLSGSLWNFHADNNLVVHWTGSGWATKTGFSEAHGLNLGTDPKIVSLTMGLGRPLSGSPLINAGATLSPYVGADLEGALRPQGGAFDIGCYEFDPNLMVHLDFKETFVADNKVVDTTGYGHDAVNLQPGNWITSTPGLNGSAGKWTVVGVMTNDPGQTYNLSQYAAITNINGLQFLTNGTISVWVQWATNGERWDTILDCGYPLPYSWDPTVATNSWALHYGSPDLTYAPTGPVFKRYGSSLNDTNGVLISWVQPRDGSNWWNIAVTWDGINNTIIGYQNGVPIQTNALGAPYLRISGSPRLGTPPYGITPWLTVGAMQHDGTPQWADDRYPNSGFFKGKMDDLRIYNRTLASQEIRSLYQGPLAITQGAPASPTPLSIVAQPQGSTVTAGGSVTFSVTATGTAPVTYQWMWNGATVAGATSSSYSKSNVQVSDAGVYSVAVYDANTSTTSSGATLTVTAAATNGTDSSLKLYLSFDQSFSGGKVTDLSGNGNHAWSFNSTNWITSATGAFGSPGGYWHMAFTMTDASQNGYPYVGMPTNGYHLYPASQYMAITNLSGIRFLTNATISVWARFDVGTNGHTLVNLLDSGYRAPNATVPTECANSWTLGRSETQNYLTFQVYPLAGGINQIVRWPDDSIGGDNESTRAMHLYSLTIDCVNNRAVAFYDGQPYMTNAINLPWVRVYGFAAPYSWLGVGCATHDGSYYWGDDKYPNDGYFAGVMDEVRIYNRVLANSEIVGLYTGSALTNSAYPPSISVQPQSVAVTVGGTASFSVTAAGTSPLAYQWKLNGANLSGATSSSYSKSNVQVADAGNYAVVVANGSGSVTSAVAVLTVSGVVTAPAITQQPSSVSVAAGSSATFTVVASGTAPLIYQWYLNGSAIAGATASSYVVNNAQAANAGVYAAYVGNSAGSIISSNAFLTLQGLPTITAAPASVITNVGSAITFTVAATGAGTLSYQWRYNGVAIPGATGTSYSRTNVQTFQSGSYAVQVSNSGGSISSQPAVLSVRELNLRVSLDFDEDFSGGRVLDVSGNGNDAWQFNPYSWITATTGAFSSVAAQFAYTSYLTNNSQQVFPVSQYLAITNPAGFLNLTNGTISFWAQFTPNNDNWMRVLDNGYSVTYAMGGSAASNSWTIGRDSTPNLTFMVYPADGSRKRVISWPNDVNAQYATTKFHLYSVSIDCVNDRMVAYYDGAPYMTNSIGLPWIHVYGGAGLPWLCIGAASGDGWPTWGNSSSPHAGYFTGKLDNLRIYSRTLTPMEVKGLYDSSPLPAPPRNLMLIPSGG